MPLHFCGISSWRFFPQLASRLHLPPWLPKPAIRIIVLLILVNVLAWVAVAVVLRYNPELISTAVLSYTLGLRHALDADHITAIDLVTRRLVAAPHELKAPDDNDGDDENLHGGAGDREQRNGTNRDERSSNHSLPATVGTFFSLGHSTIVIITCIAVAATSGALRERFDGFQRIGGIIGTSVSATALMLLCVANAWILNSLLVRLRKVVGSMHDNQGGGAGEAGVDQEEDRQAVLPVGQRLASHTGDSDRARAVAAVQGLDYGGFGVFTKVFRGLFKAIDRPWKMYPLGILFGLGFDTSSEVALLALASLQGANGTSLWVILIYPLLFTVGMCLLDTTDGALMMALYTSRDFSRDPVAILYYSIVLTAITVLVSAVIGVIQVLSLVQNVADPEGSFWDGVGVVTDHFDIIGGCICGLFLVGGVGSVMIYGTWRRKWVDQRQS